MGYLYNSRSYVSEASSIKGSIFVQKPRINTAPRTTYRFPQLDPREVKGKASLACVSPFSHRCIFDGTAAPPVMRLTCICVCVCVCVCIKGGSLEYVGKRVFVETCSEFNLGGIIPWQT